MSDPLAGGPVVYPANGQERVPLPFQANEKPDPIPEAKGQPAGYPLTVTFPPRASVRAVRGRLTDEAGRAVAAWLSSPEQPANPAYAPAQQNTICLIAHRPLQPGTRYTVHVEAEVDGKSWAATWSFRTVSEDETRRSLEGRFLDGLNQVRRRAGLGLLTLDPTRSGACRAHARYLEANLRDGEQGDPRAEVPGKPGYTPQGRDMAKTAMIHFAPAPEVVLDSLAASAGFMRNFLLDPRLKAIGVGSAPFPSSGRVWLMDLGNPWARDADFPAVLYPAAEQTDVPTDYGRKHEPNLIPAEAKGKEVGYGITANFPPGLMVTGVKARLRDDAGKEVPFWLSTPERPAISPARYVVCLIPQAPLKPGTRYSVELEADAGGPWKRNWSFTTEDPAADLVRTRREALALLNALRRTAGVGPVNLDDALSRGCLLHARYLALNARTAAGQGLNAHDEDPKLPGATPEGAKAGQAGVIAWAPGRLDGIPWWAGTLYHRVPLLAPNLKRVGFGLARHPDGNWISVLDTRGGRE